MEDGRRLMYEIESVTRRVPLLGAQSDRSAYLVSPEEWKQIEEELNSLRRWTSDEPAMPCDKISINHVEIRKR